MIELRSKQADGRKFLVLIFISLPLLYLAYAFVCNAQRAAALPGPHVATIATATPLPNHVNTPQVIERFLAIDAACDTNKTSAQQGVALERTMAFFHDNPIALTGTVFDVRKFGEDYSAQIALEKVNTRVSIDLPKKTAFDLNKGDRVLLEGVYTRYVCGIYGNLTGTLSPID